MWTAQLHTGNSTNHIVCLKPSHDVKVLDPSQGLIAFALSKCSLPKLQWLLISLGHGQTMVIVIETTRSHRPNSKDWKYQETKRDRCKDTLWLTRRHSLTLFHRSVAILVFQHGVPRLSLVLLSNPRRIRSPCTRPGESLSWESGVGGREGLEGTVVWWLGRKVHFVQALCVSTVGYST